MSDVQSIAAMVDGGIDLNSSDGGRQGNCALHWAASFADAAVVKLLCNQGADVNKTNADGATPLHDAAARGDLGVLTAFIECGADATVVGAARSVKDKIPLDMVTDSGANVTEETAAAARGLLMKAQLSGPVATAAATPGVDGAAGAAGAAAGADAATASNASSSGGMQPPEKGDGASTGGDDGEGGEGKVPASPSTPSNDTDFRDRTAVPLHPALSKLWPPPKKILQTSRRLVLLPENPSVMFKGELAPGEADTVYAYLEARLLEVGLSPARTANFRGAAAHIVLMVNATLFAKPDAYRMSVEPTGVVSTPATFHSLPARCVDTDPPQVQSTGRDHRSSRDHHSSAHTCCMVLCSGRPDTLVRCTADVAVINTMVMTPPMVACASYVPFSTGCFCWFRARVVVRRGHADPSLEDLQRY